MALPEPLAGLAAGGIPAQSLWDEENETLALRFPNTYPGTGEEVMVYVAPDSETGGWKVDDGGGASGLLDEAGADPSDAAVTAFLKASYEQSVLMMNEAGEFGIPVLEAEDLPGAVAEVAAASVALYVLGRFGAARL